MDHHEQGKIKHINRMQSKKIGGISQDRTPQQGRKVWTEKTKRRKGIMENKYNSIELKSKQVDIDISHSRNAQYLSQIRYTRHYVRLLFSKHCKN